MDVIEHPGERDEGQRHGVAQHGLGLLAHGRCRIHRARADHRAGQPPVVRLRVHRDDQQLGLLGDRVQDRTGGRCVPGRKDVAREGRRVAARGCTRARSARLRRCCHRWSPGLRGSGRQTGGRLFDNAEDHDEEAIFHAWNEAQLSRRPLLIVADSEPPLWRVDRGISRGGRRVLSGNGTRRRLFPPRGPGRVARCPGRKPG